MKLPLEFLIAFRYLKSKRRESFISVTALFSFFGIMIGVATLIIVMSVMNGFRHDLIERILGINSHISIYSSQGKINNYEEVLSEIKAIKEVKFANALIESQAMIVSDVKNFGGLIRAVKFDDLEKKELIASNITRGSLAAVNDKNKVLVGSQIAASSNLQVGDKIKLISAEINETIIGSIPRVKTYEVGGVFDSGLYEYDSSTIFMNFEMAQKHFKVQNGASAIEIFAFDASNLDELKRQLYPILIKYENLYTRDWQQANASFIEALKVESVVMFLILTLIILVAAFNIISSMIMLVNDKNKNIAMLRCMGMNRAKVMRIFLICGSSIGIVGTLLGLLLGVSFSANINEIKLWLESVSGAQLFNPAVYFLSNLPAKILISDVVLITAMSLLISFLATIYPAYKASKANPVDVLRNEN
jgi:lipoprotein-releasing system permease protein